jgi:putative tryptophan/tyrosine transport system substrate-binding protein
MRRRQFITLIGGAATWPFAARAQPAVRRIGVFTNFAENDPEGQQRLTELRLGLEKLGWVEGRNLRFDLRWSGADTGRIDEVAKELVGLRPDLIVCTSTPITAALLRETRDIPVLFVSLTDPLGQGFVKSLSKPERNCTGFTNFEFSMGAKWLELLKEVAPNVTRVSVVFNPLTSPYYPLFMSAIEAAARPLGIAINMGQLQSVDAIASTIASLAGTPNAGMVVPTDTFTSVNRERLIKLAASHRIPASYPYRFFASEGGLISYGVEAIDLFRKAPAYIDRILKGANPADLPVQQPTKFEMVINLKTAKALGLTVPPTLLARADEVIE